MDDNTFLAHAPVLRIAGEMGILIEFGAEYSPAINNAVLAFDLALNADLPVGVIETVPSFRSLLVRFDPLELEFERLQAHLQARLDRIDWYSCPPPKNRRKWLLPACYGGEFAPDLAEVADMTGQREDQVAQNHCASVLTVAMLGFSPGLAYLGQLPQIWQIPRKTLITPKVSAGSVLVAVRQTVLPATDIPTGWWQIAQTPFLSFDPLAAAPFLLSPGDQVQFEPVSAVKFASFERDDFLREGDG